MGTTHNKTGNIAAGFRKLRPALRLSRKMINKRWYTFQLIESQILLRMHQNPWPCFRSQNEIVPSVSESYQDHLWKEQ